MSLPAGHGKFGPRPKPWWERLFAKTRWEGACRVWIGAKHGEDGRGSINMQREDGTWQPEKPYVVLWRAVHGSIPVGYELHHTCFNPACVLVEHLELVTASGHRVYHPPPSGTAHYNGGKTHCKLGHAYSADNTYVLRDKSGGSHRTCKACQKLRNDAYRVRVRRAVLCQ